MGPLGIKTLSEEDYQFRGCYDNSNDSEDFTVAHGFNYHQGPEWVWPVGFFLRAYLHFSSQVGPVIHQEAQVYVNSVLARHAQHLKTSLWRGLPELTNLDGQFCAGSNPIQAWSMSTLIEVVYDMQK